MCDILAVADAAEMIVNGYAFTKDGKNVKVLNLNRTGKAAVLSAEGEVLETSMDDVELDIVLEYYRRNRKFMEV